MSIPAWVVAAFALGAAVALFVNKAPLDPKIMSLLFVMEFIVYAMFSIMDFSIETRQFSARLNNISTSLAIIVVLLVVRWKHGR